MPTFKIKRNLKDKKLISEKLKITLNLISKGLKKNKRTLIKSENTFKKYFRNRASLNLSKEEEKIVSVEIKDYIREKGYITINNRILTVKNNKVIILNKKEKV